MQRTLFILGTLILGLVSCVDLENPRENPGSQTALYFPPADGDWETITPEELEWDNQATEALLSTLEEAGTRAFIVLKDGKIVMEHYWGKSLLGLDFNADSYWYWASAGKTISAFLIGIAQQEGHLNIQDKTSDYLGEGWTSLSKDKEDLITIRHQLTMTTGLDYTVDDLYCIEPECLQFKTDAGNQWYYHNAPYTLLKDVIAAATGSDENTYCDEKLEATTGMSGYWVYDGTNNVYWSKARDMARFGLLMLNEGKWNTTQIMTDSDYFTEMTNSSQDLNPSYGYLWWLNGKTRLMLPGLTVQLRAYVASNAPADLIVAAGKNGQYLDVVPSLNMVVVRMGLAPDDALVPIEFHNEMWEKLNPVIGR